MASGGGSERYTGLILLEVAEHVLALADRLRIVLKHVRALVGPQVLAHFEVVPTSNLIHFYVARMQRWLRTLMLVHLIELLVPRAVVKWIEALLGRPEE